MACLNPIPASREYLDDSIVLHSQSYWARQADGEYLELACGRCGSCRQRNVRDWGIRSYHESLTNLRHAPATRDSPATQVSNNCFVTLTYEKMPPFGDLDLEHFQSFCNLLRKKYGPFRYLHCGEYGSTAYTARPHYHALLFGIDFHWDRVRLHDPDRPDRIAWVSPSLEKLWGRGRTEIGPLTYATAAYTAGYVVKKLRNAEWAEQHDQVDADGNVVRTKPPEYITMSRNPGLGTNWFLANYTDVYKNDEVHIDGKTFQPPKFYDKLLKRTDPELFYDVQQRREARRSLLKPTQPQELAARKSNWEARFRQKAHRKAL